MAAIYVASKTKHAARWKALRAAGVPIISTWIDEAGAGETGDWGDLWCRCVEEAARSTALIAHHEEGETSKGTLVEIGTALAAGTRVYAVGYGPGQTWVQHPGVTVCGSLLEALMQAVKPPSLGGTRELDWGKIDEALRAPPQSGPSHAPADRAPPPEAE